MIETFLDQPMKSRRYKDVYCDTRFKRFPKSAFLASEKLKEKRTCGKSYAQRKSIV
jgi:hypothetical protein